MTRFLMHVYDSDLSILVCYLCTPFGIRITTHWGVLTPLDPYVQVSELGACEFSRLLIRVSQQKSGSSANRLKPYSFRPLRISRVFLL